MKLSSSAHPLLYIQARECAVDEVLSSLGDTPAHLSMLTVLVELNF